MGVFKAKKQFLTNRAVIYYNAKKVGKCYGVVPKIEEYSFEWGRSGYGQEHLSLAMLMQICGEDVAIKYYKIFSEDYISFIKDSKWSITENQIKEKITSYMRQDYDKNLISLACKDLDATRRKMAHILDVTEETIDVWSRNNKNIPRLAQMTIKLLIENNRYKLKIENLKDLLKSK